MDNVINIKKIEKEKIDTFSNSYKYFSEKFDDFYDRGDEIELEYDETFEGKTYIILNQNYNKYIQEENFPILKYSSGFKRFIAIPFILDDNDNIVKYIFLTINKNKYGQLFIESNAKDIGCKDARNEYISIFSIGGNLKNDPDEKKFFTLGLSNSPSDCIEILFYDQKLCNASNLIRQILKIANYFGIYDIDLMDHAGIYCRMDKNIGKNICGLKFKEKNIPLSIQRKIMRKKGFYEEIGFSPKKELDYDSFFYELGNFKMRDLLSENEFKDFFDLFEDDNITLENFIQNYNNMKYLIKNDKFFIQKCKWIEIFLNNIYDGKNIFLIKNLPDYVDMITSYSKQIFKY
jgi:hypothetical protein